MSVNPFQPNSPVAPGMFAGRVNEILALEGGLKQTSQGYPANFIVSGERGIGKSSLLLILQHFAEGRAESFEHGEFNYICVPTMISSQTHLLGFLKLLQANLSREVGKTESIRNFLQSTWDFIQRVKVMDSGVDRSVTESDPDVILSNFTHSLAATTSRVCNPEKGEEKKDGILFIIDEVDNACDELQLGYFFKIITELLQKCGCNNVMFVIAGLPELVGKLSSSHPSSIRIFQHLKIRELNPVDRKYVIDRGLKVANEVNSTKTSISEEAKESISTLSEGYPHFIQQFAFSAFEFNNDGEISRDDVLKSAFKDGGALDAIGDRYYAIDYHSKIKSDEYREVLRIMAENLNEWIKKSEIREKFTGQDHIITDALKALTERKIILRNPSKIGEYRLQHKGFAHWIKLFGERKY